MSRVTIYEVQKSGDVVPFAEEHNAMAWSPVIWNELGRRYLGQKPHAWIGDEGAVEKLWALFDTGKLTPNHRLVLGLTFDRVWVKRARVSDVVFALDVFDADMRRVDGNQGVDTTISRVRRTICALMVARPEAIGFAFHGTSVSESMWKIYRPDGEFLQHVNVLQEPPTCADGDDAWEIGDPPPAIQPEVRT